MSEEDTVQPRMSLVSRSGPIRQLIRPTEIRLKECLKEVSSANLHVQVDETESAEANIATLENLAFMIHNFLKRVEGSVKMLDIQNQKWQDLMMKLQGEELAAESALYKEVTAEDSFLSTMLNGIDAIHMLESRLSEAEHTIARIKHKQNKESQSPPALWGMSVVNQSSPVQSQVRVHLPKLQLPTYYGDPQKWIEFWDAYEASVHVQDIPNVQKFNYLLSALKGSAYKAIEGMAVTNVNYEEAVDVLKKRFGNPTFIKQALYAELRNLPISSSKTMDLRHTMEGIDRVCRQLKALGEDLNQPTLIIQIQEKMPPAVLLELGRIKKPEEIWKIDDLREELNKIVQIKEEMFRILQNSPGGHSSNSNNSKGQKQGNKFEQSSQIQTFAALSADNKRSSHGSFQSKSSNGGFYPCAFCNGNHMNEKCNMFKTVPERKMKIQELKLCFRCLRSGHFVQECRFQKPCVHCSGNHNRALCNKQERESSKMFTASKEDKGSGKVTSQTEVHQVKESINAEIHTVLETEQSEVKGEDAVINSTVMETMAVSKREDMEPNHVALLTAKVQVVNLSNKGTSSEAYAFFDSGSQRSFITNCLLEKLHLPIYSREIINVHTFASTKAQEIRSIKSEVGIKLQNGEVKNLQVNAVSKLTDKLKVASLKPEDWRFIGETDKETEALKRQICEESVIEPDILIGADYFWEFLDQRGLLKLPSGLFIVPSSVGLLVSGRTTLVNEPVSNNCTVTTPVTLSSEEKKSSKQNREGQEFLPSLESFWSLETIGIKDSPEEKDDDIALKQFIESVQFQNGRYHVKWPWKSKEPDLQDNYGLSYGRLKSLMRRFQADPELLKKYDEIIQEQLIKGIIEKVEDTNTGSLKHYLPHHAVVTPAKMTTKVRIVYDASARTKKGANSLNDCLYRGPIIMPDLCGMLIRFRMYPVALVADVEKAFLQISLQESDRDVTRFLWLKDPAKLEVDRNIQVYRFCRVAFGVISSPFLLNATLQYHLKHENTEEMLQLAKNIYVDNVLMGADSEEQALEIYKQAKKSFSKASMNLREWTSNSNKVCMNIPTEDQLKEESTKVLGILWNTTKDTMKLTIDVKENSWKEEEIVTKRNVLKQVASTFDPMGLLSPVLLTGKKFLQVLWQEKFDWDEPLPKELADQWKQVLLDWYSNSNFFISRQLPHIFDGNEYQLVTFVDASAEAYAVVVYLRTQARNDVTTHIVFSKNRVAPKKRVTIPRLELMAGVIGARATKFVEKEIGIPIVKKTIFTDSECVLHWLTSTKPLEVFVENRLKELQSHKDIHFCYVSSKENPADIATHGLPASELGDLQTWWFGPEWLKMPSKNWIMGTVPEVTPEMMENVYCKTEVEVSCQAVVKEIKTPIIDLGRFSSLIKARRVTTYILRFIKIKVWNKLNDKSKMQNLFENVSNNGEITAKEIKSAEEVLIKMDQQDHYPQLKNQSKLDEKFSNQLGVREDGNGFLRCYGRLSNAPLTDDTKYPILLARKTALTKLIIQDCHKTVLHAGANHTLSEVRRHYWIPKGRAEVKRVLHNGCFICKKYKVGPYKLPKMPPFPKERVSKAKPFQFIGLDYFGPIAVKVGEERVKVWVCLFTCLVTRAIHLEMVSDLSTATFLNCMRRFIGRRGKPEKIISDNAAHFKLTNKVMENAWQEVHSDPTLFSYCSNQKIQWHFNTEYAPWQGGFYERLIGMVKQCMRKVIGRRLLNSEELQTLLVEVEAVLNSRPLTFLPDTTEGGQILRPVDFLTPQGEIGIPNIEEGHSDPEWFPKLDSTEKMMVYWRKSIEHLDKFWKLWSDEYILSLRERFQVEHKGPRVRTNAEPQINDIVLVKDENVSRGMWKLGKIVGTPVSSDMFVRSAEIQLPNKSIIKRPINLLYPLETANPSNYTPIEELGAKDDAQTHVLQVLLNAIMGIHVKKSTVLLLITMLLATLCNFCWCAEEYRHMCPLQAALITITSESCVSNGIVVKRMKGRNLCWQKVSCPTGHLLESGSCGNKCACPDWADDCSHYSGPQLNGFSVDIDKIMESEQPNICSYTPDQNCDEHPIHAKLAKIQLYDNSTYIVKNLRLVHSAPLKDNYICVGEGPQVGTPQFCKNFRCEAKGTKFCYYNFNEIVKFISENGEIPIKAWGSELVTFFGYKTVPKQNPLCTECSLTCIQGGVEIKLNENIGLIEVCSKPYCYKVSHPKSLQVIQFPRDVVLSQHQFQMKVWSNGYLIKNFELDCPSSPFCEMVDCYFCWDLVGNPQCAPKAALMVFFIGFYFAAGSMYFFVKLFKHFVKIFGYGLYFILYFLHFCRIILKRLFHKIYSALVGLINRTYETENNTQNANFINSDEEESPGPSRNSKSGFSYRPTPKTYTFIATIVIIFAVHGVSGCAEVVSLTAQRSVCSVHANGAMECVLTEATRLALVPQGQDTCLLIKDPNGEPLGTIAIEVEKITVACQKKNEYYTRSFSMTVESSKRCPNMGSCTGEKCGSINLNSKVDELQGEANNSPGFTYCMESCACWGCGCFYCTSSCLFYRTFAVPVTDIVYEVFSCPVWEYKVRATVRINLQGETRQESFELRPGIQTEWKNVKLALTSISNPPVPILGSQFLTDGAKTVMVRASASGQPVSSTVGEIQCSTKEKASNFDCYLPHDSCTCHSRETYVSCNCAERTLEPLFGKIEYVLPMTSEGISIFGSGNNIEAEYNQIASLELQVSMEGFRLATKVEKNHCIIKPLSFAGCYSCFTGAKLQFECKTDFGEALAHVNCGVGTFSTVCSPDGIKAIATMNFPHASVKETCSVLCPAGTSTFQIEANLVFIEKERLGNITNVISAANAADGNIDLGFLAGWLSENWVFTILIIIAVIILIPITLVCFPLFLNIIFNCSRNARNVLWQKFSSNKQSVPHIKRV